MSLATNLQSLATRIATEVKSLRVLINNNVADLTALTTTVKTNLVSAINEVVTNVAARELLSNKSNDGTLAADSATLYPTQHAVKTYADTAVALRELLSNKSTDGTLAANSDTLYPSQKAVKTYADALIAANDAMVYKGVINASGNPNYPAADAGHTYRISVAGKIGGALGPNVEVGDTLICITDGSAAGTHASVGANWNILQANLDGAVIGPASVTDVNPAVFDGVTGKLIKQITYAVFKTNLALVKADVGLSNVDNTSDVNKPVSTAQQTALDLKANTADVGDTTTNFVTTFEAGLV
jgi:hypothetical protein